MIMVMYELFFDRAAVNSRVISVHFDSTYRRSGTVQRMLSWPPYKKDT